MKTWHKVLIISACLLPIAIYATAVAVYNSIDRPKQPVVHVYTTEELLAEANRLRAEKGVAPLRIDERLNQSAQWKANDMKEFGYYGHVKPGEDRTNGAYKAADLTGIECTCVSENIDGALLYQSPFEGEGWISSKPHYEAVINPRYETTGFGVVRQGDQMLYVQHFCDLR